MEGFRTEEHGVTKDLAGANTSRSVKSRTTRHAADPDDQVACEALHLALSVIHLDIAWHTGVIGVEAAMESLHREIVETVSRLPPPIRTSEPKYRADLLCQRLR
jgi:hypothetical protein